MVSWDFSQQSLLSNTLAFLLLPGRLFTLRPSFRPSLLWKSGAGSPPLSPTAPRPIPPQTHVFNFQLSAPSTLETRLRWVTLGRHKGFILRHNDKRVFSRHGASSALANFAGRKAKRRRWRGESWPACRRRWPKSATRIQMESAGRGSLSSNDELLISFDILLHLVNYYQGGIQNG